MVLRERRRRYPSISFGISFSRQNPVFGPSGPGTDARNPLPIQQHTVIAMFSLGDGVQGVAGSNPAIPTSGKRSGDNKLAASGPLVQGPVCIGGVPVAVRDPRDQHRGGGRSTVSTFCPSAGSREAAHGCAARQAVLADSRPSDSL